MCLSCILSLINPISTDPVLSPVIPSIPEVIPSICAVPIFLVKLAASIVWARCGFNGTFLTGDLKNFKFLTSSLPFIRLPFIFVTSAEFDWEIILIGEKDFDRQFFI